MKPGDIIEVNGKLKICHVGAFTDKKTGEFYSALKLYCPKTKEDIRAIRKFVSLREVTA